MRLDHAAIVLRPRGILGSADLAFRFVFALRRRLWLSLCALTLLPGLAGCLWLAYGLNWPWVSVWAIAFVYGMLAQGAFSTAAGLLMFDRDVRFTAVLRSFLGRLFQYSVAMLWTRGLAAALAPVMAIGFFLWIRWAYVPESVLLEHASAFRAGGRSNDFTKGHLEDAVGVVALAAGLHFSMAVAFEELGHGVEAVLVLPVHFDSLWDVGGSPYALLGYFMALPFCAVLRFLSYIDGRTRRDGWDIQVRFMALANEANPQERRLEAAT